MEGEKRLTVSELAATIRNNIFLQNLHSNFFLIAMAFRQELWKGDAPERIAQWICCRIISISALS